MDYSKFQNWKNSHANEMQDLSFARPDDIFIFTRFTGHLPFDFEGKQVLFAESIKEAIGYIRHIFLYDILNDTTDDLEINFRDTLNERQKDAILLLNYWFKLGKITTAENYCQEFSKFCRDFNSEFNHRKDIEYEMQILNGADELRDFLIKKYSVHEEFDKERLCDICSRELFAGKPLKDFLDKLFR